jgi:hypothetical protein
MLVRSIGHDSRKCENFFVEFRGEYLLLLKPLSEENLGSQNIERIVKKSSARGLLRRGR